MEAGCASPTQAPTAPPILTPVHQLLPRRRADLNSNDGKACRLCRGGSPGEGPAEGALVAWLVEIYKPLLCSIRSTDKCSRPALHAFDALQLIIINYHTTTAGLQTLANEARGNVTHLGHAQTMQHRKHWKIITHHSAPHCFTCSTWQLSPATLFKPEPDFLRFWTFSVACHHGNGMRFLWQAAGSAIWPGNLYPVSTPHKPCDMQQSKEAPTPRPSAAACTLLCGRPRPLFDSAARSSAPGGIPSRCAASARPRSRPQTSHTCASQRECQAGKITASMEQRSSPPSLCLHTSRACME